MNLSCSCRRYAEAVEVSLYNGYLYITAFLSPPQGADDGTIVEEEKEEEKR
jgi:hypothetical protein